MTTTRLIPGWRLIGDSLDHRDQFEKFREQGLVVKTKTGGVLITGCGHPGPVEIMDKAEKEMGVLQICPTHCTGDKSIAFLKKSFGEGYISGGTGKEIIIE